MKEFIQKYQKAIVGTGAVSVLLICYYQQKELSKLRSEQIKVYNVPVVVDSLQSTIDSLNSEVFILQTQNGRYELSLEHLYEANPKAGKQFDEYLNKYPSSVRAITKEYGVIEDKKTLCLKVSYYNHSKANKLLFRVLEEKLAQWWD